MDTIKINDLFEGEITLPLPYVMEVEVMNSWYVAIRLTNDKVYYIDQKEYYRIQNILISQSGK
jgi:hypothetical protein